MVWVRLEDGMYTHPKLVEVSPPARWLLVASICYSNQNATDGYLTRAAAESVGLIRQPTRAIAELLKAGLWERAGDGFLIHDYLQYQPSREKVLRERDLAAARQARRRRGGNGQFGGRGDPPDESDVTAMSRRDETVTSSVSHGSVTTTPVPNPPYLHPQTTDSRRQPNGMTPLEVAEERRQRRLADQPDELDVERGLASTAAVRAALEATRARTEAS